MGSEENKKLGFIVLFRSLINWEWFTDQNTLQVFLYCLLSANHKDKNYKGTLIKRGSFATSYDVIGQNCGLTRMQARTAIKHLKKSNNLTTKFNGKGLIISINNYEDYQAFNMHITSKEHAGNMHITPNNNDNNENNVVVQNTPTYSNNFLTFWDAYGKRRNKKRVYEVWVNLGCEQVASKVIYGAKQYAKATPTDKRMVPIAFLEEEVWKDYKEQKSNNLLDWLEEQDRRKGLIE